MTMMKTKLDSRPTSSARSKSLNNRRKRKLAIPARPLLPRMRWSRNLKPLHRSRRKELRWRKNASNVSRDVDRISTSKSTRSSSTTTPTTRKSMLAVRKGSTSPLHLLWHVVPTPMLLLRLAAPPPLPRAGAQVDLPIPQQEVATLPRSSGMASCGRRPTVTSFPRRTSGHCSGFLKYFPRSVSEAKMYSPQMADKHVYLTQKEEIEFAIISAYCWNYSFVYELMDRKTPVIAVDHSPTGTSLVIVVPTPERL